MSCCGRNSCISWMSLARSWLSLAMLQISSWLKSGWICLHKSIWLMTLPIFDGPARFSVVYLEENKINNTYWYVIAIIIAQNDWFSFICVIFFFLLTKISSHVHRYKLYKTTAFSEFSQHHLAQVEQQCQFGVIQ